MTSQEKRGGLNGNILWILGEKILRIGTGVLITAAVAKALGPEQYSKVAYVAALCSGFLVFSQFGLERVLITRISRRARSFDRIRRPAQILRLIGLLVATALVLPILWIGFAGQEQQTITLIAIPVVYSIFFISEIDEYYLHASGQSRISAIVRMAANVSLGIGRLVLLNIEANAVLFAAIICVEPVAYFIFMRMLVNSNANEHRTNSTRVLRILKVLAPRSLPLLVSFVCVFLYTKADQLILVAVASAQEAGIYAAITPLSNQNIFILAAAISTAFLPIIAKSQHNTEYQALGMNLAAVLYAVFPVVVLMQAISPSMIRLLLGESFSPGVPALRIHLCTCVLSALNLVQNNWLIHRQKPSAVLLKTLVAAATGVISALILCPDFGAIGAALAAVLAEALALMAGAWILGREFSVAMASAMKTSGTSLIKYLRESRV